MKNIFLLTLCMGVACHCFGQISAQEITKKSETPSYLGLDELEQQTSRIEVDLGNKNKLQIFVRVLQELDNHRDIDSLLALFVKDYQVLKANLKETTAARSVKYTFGKDGKTLMDMQEFPQAIERIQYKQGSEPISLKTQMDTLKIVFQIPNPTISIWEKLVKIYGIDNPEIQIYNHIYIYVIVNQLEDIVSLSAEGVNPKVNSALADIRAYKGHDLYKHSSVLHFNYRSDAPRYTKQNADRQFTKVQTYKNPFLAFHNSMGVGLVKDQWTMNIQSMMSFVPSRNKNIGYSIGLTSMYSYEFEPTSIYSKKVVNTFGQVGLTFYNTTRQSKLKHDNWVLGGIYLGYLSKAQGNLFQNNTFYLSATIWAKGLFKIQPEIYIHKLFNNQDLPYTGIRLQVGF